MAAGSATGAPAPPGASAAGPAGALSAAGAPSSAATSTAMIGVPTSTVWPSPTSSPATTPSNGQGSSTTALAVSISTMVWLICTWSPGWTRQLTMSASVSPSPTSGSLNSRRCVICRALSAQ